MPLTMNERGNKSSFTSSTPTSITASEFTSSVRSFATLALPLMLTGNVRRRNDGNHDLTVALDVFVRASLRSQPEPHDLRGDKADTSEWSGMWSPISVHASNHYCRSYAT